MPSIFSGLPGFGGGGGGLSLSGGDASATGAPMVFGNNANGPGAVAASSAGDWQSTLVLVSVAALVAVIVLKKLDVL